MIVYEFPPGHKQAAALVGTIPIDPVTGLPVDMTAGLPVRGGNEDVFDVTLVLDTSAYADNDVLFIGQEITNFFSAAGGKRMIQNLAVIDEDDQGVGFDLLLFNADPSIGTINSPPSISDANVRKFLGKVSVAAGDYIDLGGCRVADVTPIGKELKGVTTSLWIAGITRLGTPTYTAAGLKLKIGVI
ncbi:hypothetical protein C3941_19860 [Kaistia algarum]|nr:hypothetical protein C3941_19860 [Kaistia algarum]